MHHEPESTDPTTHEELEDFAAHAQQANDAAGDGDDVEAHMWGNKPPIVDETEKG